VAIREPDFVLIQRDLSYERIPQLVEHLVEFVGSQEWQELLQNDLDELPGVVLGALRRFLIRLSTEAATLSTASLAGNLSHGFEFIEKLVASEDTELQNAVVIEIFEPLEPGTNETRRFYEHLAVRSAELYRKHCLGP